MTIVPNITVLIQIALVLVLMVVLNTFLFKPMMGVLNERKARTAGRRERAAAAEAQADTIWGDYQKKLTVARSEAEKSRLEVVRQAETERAKITEVASAEADKTITEMKARIGAEGSRARETLKAEIEGLGKVMAEKIAGRAV